jgi:hypothetical protein
MFINFQLFKHFFFSSAIAKFFFWRSHILNYNWKSHCRLNSVRVCVILRWKLLKASDAAYEC